MSDEAGLRASAGARKESAPRRARSFATRLFVSAALWAGTVLLIGGVTLSSYYTRSVERGFDQRLHVYLKTLVGAVAEGGFGRRDPGSFGEPRFDLPLSGWYWQINRIDRDPPEATTSKSLFEEQLPRLADLGVAETIVGTREGYAEGPDDTRLRMVERTIDLGQDGRYLITIGGAAAEIDDDVANFNAALVVSFLALFAGLMATTWFQVGFGLRPLRRIRAQLADIRAGRRARLDGAFPREIEPLAGELNALLESNREIVERARTHVGNLAHGLKTPLSVISNEANAGAGPFADKVREQAGMMQRQIDHHLERARLSAGVAFVGEATEVKPVLDALARTMEKVHRGRDIAAELACAEDLRFRGEKQDLEEMVGNLVDNAFKWAGHQVAITAEASARPALEGRATFRVVIDDDGPGLGQSEREEVMRRGRRLDETKPGSGLGLAIVNDLAAMYGGSLALDRSPAGGLRCALELPAA